MIPVIIHDSPRVLLIPQTLYECATTQGGWVKQAPIEFERIKLADAANQRYLNARSDTDKVLNYEGVGSSILCRLIVCRTSHTPQTSHLTFFSLFQFHGEEIGKSKVRLTAVADWWIFLRVKFPDLDNEPQNSSRVHYEGEAGV